MNSRPDTQPMATRSKTPPEGAPPPDRPAPGDSYVQSFARGLQVIRSFSAQAPRQTQAGFVAQRRENLGLSHAPATRRAAASARSSRRHWR